jgi:hypothetical protein
VSIEATVICDGCSIIIAAAKTPLQARETARQVGAAVNLSGGKDLCVTCKPQAEVTPYD